jgi:hypothetical protein
MKNNCFVKILFFFTPFIVSCQTLKVDTMASLPVGLKESSGLVVESPNLFWTHNDGGDASTIYQIDSTGKLLRTVKLKNAANVDWEEMTLDTEGSLYIGDFGNNGEDRRNLLIYKILNFKNKYQTNAISHDAVIEFSYEDQRQFPPTDSLKHFDAEAMLVEKDSIYIITKDFDTDPYTGKTWIYSIPNVGGKHVAKLTKVLNTESSWKFKGAITASTKGYGKVVLMSYLKLFVFSDFGSKSFWEGTKKVLDFSMFDIVQREAVAFHPTDSCRLYITSEEAKGIGGNLSTVNICPFLSKTKDTRSASAHINVHPTPSVSDVFFELKDIAATDLRLNISDINGRSIFQKDLDKNEDKILLEKNLFPTAGLYFYQLFSKTNADTFVGKILIIN